MTARTHYVYRAYDEFGLLLYVGCSKNPENRHKQHQSAKSEWLPYMAKARLEGPYTKAAAFAQEKSVIATEAPFFNSSAEHMSNNVRRRKVRTDLLAKARRLEPDVFSDIHSATPEAIEELHAVVEIVEAQTEAIIPAMGPEYRLNLYLAARELELSGVAA